MRHLFVYGLTCFVLLASAGTRANLPLVIDDLLTQEGRLRLDSSLTYAAAERQNLRTDYPVAIQVGSVSFITLPSLIEELHAYQDVLAVTTGLRYGLHRQSESYVRASWLYEERRISSMEGMLSNSGSRFGEAWAGINHQFRQDTTRPGLLGFAEVALREHHASLRSWMLGLTSYRALDPVVLSMTGSFRYSHGRSYQQASYRPASIFLLNPQLAFAVNERITLTGGVQWTQHSPERLDGIAQNLRHSSTDLLLAAGYGSSSADTLNLAFKMNASGRGGADLRLNWLHSF